MTTAIAPPRTNSLPDGWAVRIERGQPTPRGVITGPGIPTEGTDATDTRVPETVAIQAQRAVAHATASDIVSRLVGEDDAALIAALTAIKASVFDLSEQIDALIPLERGTDATAPSRRRHAAQDASRDLTFVADAIGNLIGIIIDD